MGLIESFQSFKTALEEASSAISKTEPKEKDMVVNDDLEISVNDSNFGDFLLNKFKAEVDKYISENVDATVDDFVKENIKIVEKKKEKKMNLRLRALDRETNQIVKCTLRRQVSDLTVSDLSIPAYTHLKGKTVSGRLVQSSNPEEFAEFEFKRV